MSKVTVKDRCLVLLIGGAICATASAATLTVGQSNGPCPSAQYATIGAAVSAAAARDVIEICPALYPEQLVITKPLTLRGIRATVSNLEVNRVLLQPTLQTLPGVPGEAVITVVNTQGVTIENLALDASQNTVSGCSTLLAGVHFFNASGTVRRSVIAGAQLANPQSCFNTPVSDNGSGVLIDNGGSASQSVVTIENNSIHDFTSYGVFAVGAGITAEVDGNNILGAGPGSGVFQFGVVLLNGAAGIIHSNVITEGPCGALSLSDCYNVHSGGIVLKAIGDGTIVDGNIVTDSQSGIYVARANRLTISHNRIRNIVGAGLDAIDLVDTVTESLIDDNMVSNLGPMSNQGCGILEATGAGITGNTISNNTISDAYCGVAFVEADHVDSGRYFNTLYTELDGDVYENNPPPPVEPLTIAVTGPGASAGAALAPNTFETANGLITLSASASPSANAGTLMYRWAPANGASQSALQGAATSTVSIELPTKGTYQFMLTVTSSVGASATSTITVQYV